MIRERYELAIGRIHEIPGEETVAAAFRPYFKKVSGFILMLHELMGGGCQMEVHNLIGKEISLQGDVNNLIQAVNNLISNAIHAQKQIGGGIIDIDIYHDEEYLKIAVKDRGKGVSPYVREKLFKSMVTSKGTMGTGLGLYISNIVIKGKFEGHLWMEDREGGGSIFGIAIPHKLVNIR